MTKMTISMPETMRDYVAVRVSEGQYGNVSEYFRDLVRREQERREAISELRQMIDEGDASGTSPLSAEEIWAEAEQRHLARNG